MPERLEVIAFIAATITAAIGLISTLYVARKDAAERHKELDVRLEETNETTTSQQPPDVVFQQHAMTRVTFQVAAPRKRKIFISALFEIGVLASGGLALIERNWPALVFCAALAVALPAWFLAIYAPTTCGVTTAQGQPCKRATRGVLFGCHLHTYAKFFARLGWHTQPVPTSELTQPADQENDLKSMRIAEPRRDRLAFWVAVGASVMGVISAAIDIMETARTSGG